MGGILYAFPGQGSQEPQMLRDLESQVADDFREASQGLDYDLWEFVQESTAEQLAQTRFTQPALLTASVALYRLAQRRGAPPPSMVAGHSVGEYSALVAAEALSLRDAAALVAKRGAAMEAAVPNGKGGMAAVLKLDDAKVVEICQESAGAGLVEPVNFNAPGQLVIAGELAALETASAACAQAGGRVIRLQVSGPFHSKLMEPARKEMVTALEAVTFGKPQVPVLQNVDGRPHADPEELRANLVTQMTSPVLWTETVRHAASLGVDLLVECGPGKVLAGLARRIAPDLRALGMNDSASLEKTLGELANG